MTCIIAIETDAGVWMGADRLASLNGTKLTIDVPKIFEVGELLIGASGPVRLSQLLATLNPPVHTLGWDIDRWVTLDLAAAARQHLAGNDYDRKIENRSWVDGRWIVAVRGRAYTIHSDYSWTRGADGIHAIGSGADHALGAINALRSANVENDPSEQIRLALRAAADLDSGVGGPFDLFVQEAHA